MSPLSAFADPDHTPGEDELRSVLGSAAAAWRSLLTKVSERHGPVSSRWHHAGPKYGWSLRVSKGERVALHLTPGTGSFLAGLALGEKALAAARGELSAQAVAIVEAAPRYAEGRGIRMTVGSDADVGLVLELLVAKLAPPRRSPPVKGPRKGRPSP